MKDELVRRALLGPFAAIVFGLSGCNGCNGCEGQTPAPPAAPTPKDVAPVEPSAAPRAVVAPAVSVVPTATVSVAPHPDHDPTGVRLCCKTISDNLASVPDKHKATWTKALQACNDAAEKKTGRKGLEPVRDILTPVGWPAACQ